MGRAFEYRKARKMARWDKMAKTFTKLGKEIVIAVKASGPDADTNPRLRALLQNCKAANMPKDNIDRAIKRAISKDTSDYKEILYEGYAPHGIAVVVESATDNNTRTVANVRSYFNKCKGNMGTQGSVEFMFDHKCHFKVVKPAIDLEELELELIDFGVDEIFEEEDGVMIYGEFTAYGALQKALEEHNIEVISSGFERIPQTTKELNEEETADVEKLIDMLEEDDDVQNVYTSMA